MVVVVTNPWVIVFLHCHFLLVLILQITMLFSTTSSRHTSSWKLFLKKASKQRVPFEQSERMVAHWIVSKNSRKLTEESISTLYQLIRLNWFGGTTIVVTTGSNAMSLEPVGNVKRWKRGKGSVTVSQPHATKACSKCMGGVDLVDRALSYLRPNFNGKKWYWSLIINALNIGFACILLAITAIVHKAKRWSEVFPPICSSSCVDESSQQSSQTRCKFRHSRWSTIWRQRTLPSTRTSEEMCLVRKELPQCVWKM